MVSVTITIERNLGLLEKYQLACNLLNCYGSIKLPVLLDHLAVEGYPAHFHLNTFQPALRTLLDAHPNLLVTIRDKKTKHAHFVLLSHADLSKIVLITQPQEKKMDQIVQELVSIQYFDNQDIETDPLLPLWRLHVVPQSTTSCIVSFVVSHVVADGMSLTVIWKEFLKALKNDSHTDSSKYIVKINTNQRVPPPYEKSGASSVSFIRDVLPKAYTDLLPSVLPTCLARLINPIRYKSWKGEALAVPGQKHDSCKRGISAHAVLVAAKFLVWAHLYPQACTKFYTSINTRGFCHPPLSPNRIGNFIGIHDSIWDTQQLLTQDIWTIAAMYHQDLQKHKYDGIKETLMIKYLGSYPKGYYKYPEIK
ncbi:uncharacterized protein B0P05DRAFT_641257 [Gilbertella persicaria]|uniref:uncharacterized protein n=1 Tax=Gilbertella persicaria TaxID=101096 RepID=UPI0022200EC8|nr:uncharacterized protein B0P05DRAFT_641257 [Gilbertella persicaria]KAI8055601.1 hypothetical protein B0P05DRAFT_641257 [Gilbertella persicaria]